MSCTVSGKLRAASRRTVNPNPNPSPSPNPNPNPSPNPNPNPNPNPGIGRMPTGLFLPGTQSPGARSPGKSAESSPPRQTTLGGALGAHKGRTLTLRTLTLTLALTLTLTLTLTRCAQGAHSGGDAWRRGRPATEGRGGGDGAGGRQGERWLLASQGLFGDLHVARGWTGAESSGGTVPFCAQ